MKKIYLILAAAVGMTITSCTTNDYLGEVDPNAQAASDGAIRFDYKVQGTTRAGELVGDAAAAKLGNMFVVEGTKGSEQDNSPSTDVVFDNYLVIYGANTAATTESNSNNWEYVGKEAGVTGKLSSTTWGNLHGSGTAQMQTIKYWDYTQAQYDFIAWSTGAREAVTTAAEDGKVKVTRIAKGAGLSTAGFTLTAYDVDDLMQCYYTDIITVKKADDGYGKPVTLTFRNMATKVRVALYETIPGYSVRDVKFYSADGTTLGTETSTTATLFTTGSDVLPRSGNVLVYYPHIGTAHRDASPAQTKDYNKASVTVTSISGGGTSTTQTFGELSKFVGRERYEDAVTEYLGRDITQATFAGKSAENYYTAVFPNSTGKALTLRVDYKLVSIDGSTETINVYGAKAVVPATYTEWQPNYAYTYIFKISDNTNGKTSTLATDPEGLFPITFDAVVTNFVDVNAEQTTVTTVATPSITMYQQGHDWANKDEYNKNQTAGVSSEVKDLYVQVMDNSGTTSTLKGDLNKTNKSLLFKITKGSDNYVASEAEVMDALQNRTSWDSEHPVDTHTGRNGITLTTNANISNTETSIINGVDDQPITEIAGTAITEGQVAKINIDQLETGTYAYVYCTTVPSTNEEVYHIAAGVTSTETAATYYEVEPDDILGTACASGVKAVAGRVYFVKNVDANDNFVSYTFKQTKVGDEVGGLHMASIPANPGTSSYSADNFYFDVYNQNKGAYAVKVFKVVAGS